MGDASRSVDVALTESTRAPFVARTIDAVRAWMIDGSDRSRAQRAAGAAFLIRVASAALVYLTQVLLARWFNKSRGKAMGVAYLGIGLGGALAQAHAL